MKVKLLFAALSLMTLWGCCCNPAYILPKYSEYCQQDYWGDNQFNIFGRKNCVGSTGRWIDYDNGRDGYYCTNAKCSTYDRPICSETCCGPS